MNNYNFLICGATGTVGSHLVRHLSNTNNNVFAACRFKSKGDLNLDNVTNVEMDYSNSDSIFKALNENNIDKIFLLFPESPDMITFAKNVVNVAKETKVSQIVFMSGAGVEVSPDAMLSKWLKESENIIITSGVNYTIIRPVFFMQNFINFYAPQPDGNIYAPLGNNKISYINADDIALAISKVLEETTDKFLNQTFTITGDSYSINDVVTIMSAAKSVKIGYFDIPEEAAKEAMLSTMPEHVINVILEVFAGAKAGRYDIKTNDFEKITNKKPSTIFDFFKNI